MTRQIEVNRHWLPNIQKLVSKFNKYAGKRSLSSVADTLDKIVKIMKKETGDIRMHAAEALSAIRVFNPSLILRKTSEFIDLVLAENGQGTFTQPNYTQPDYVDYSSQDYSSDSSNYNYESPPTSTYVDIGASSSSPSNYSGESYSTSSEDKKYEEWNEEEDSNFTEDLMAAPIEKLNIKNVSKVYMKDEYIKRKCAMGDGEFGEGYEGDIYECTCGTLYHETCLKVQALYTGICTICDREFLKKD